MKRTNKGNLGASLGALSFSLIIHVVLFSIFSSVVIFQAVIPKQGFLDAPTFSQDEQIFAEDLEMLELEEPILDPITPEDNGLTMEPSETAPIYTNMADIITAQSVESTHTIEAIPDNAILTMDPVKVTHSTNQFSGNAGSVVSGNSSRVVANLFGTKVAANSLGVIVDVSTSTHKVIQVPLKEIDKNFPNALIVLSPGCGMDPAHKGDTYPAETFEEEIWLKKRYDQEFNKYAHLEKTNERLYALKRKFFKFNIHEFLVELLDTNKEFNSFYKKAKREGRLYIQNDVLIQGEKKQEGNRTSAIQGAFDFLTKQGVDTIYWFADFRDKIDNELAKKLIKDLHRNAVTVYCHDFRAPDITTTNQPHAKTIADISNKTGGTFIYKTIKAK